MITQSSIDQIFETARVEEVIGEFVQLKKSGSNFKGLSPFSEEKTPSFMVSPVKQIWKDFSSGKGGNVVSFLMEQEHYTYPEALRWLANKYNIQIEETQLDDQQKHAMDERESMYVVSEYASKYFHDILLNNEQGKAIGLSYFKERGYREDTIKKFQLGYALDQWEAFTKTALSKQYDLKYLEKTGLTIVKETKQFDRFKGRVIFPIHSMSGRVLGFGGRILNTNAKAAKYLNSPTSEIYDKSKILYGIYYAKQTIAKENNCYLVEGYTDVITLHQSGILNVVASSGTALTPMQIRLIKRLTPNITVLFDGDAAGLRASMRGIDLILEQGMNVKVLTFPDGDDPDSFAKKVSSEELATYLKEKPKDFIKFKISVLLEEAQEDPVKKADLVRDIIHSISVIPDRIQREIYVKECANLMDVSEEVLFSNLAQQIARGNQDKGRKTQQQTQQFEVVKTQQQTLPKINQLEKYEREIIKILLLYGNKKANFIDWIEEKDSYGKLKLTKETYENNVAQEIYLNLQEDEIAFTNPLFQKIYNTIIQQFNQKQEIDVQQLSQHEDTSLSSITSDILMEEEKYTLSDWERKNIFVKPKETHIPKLVTDVVLNLRRVLIVQKINEITAAFKENQQEKEKLEEIMNYTKLRKLLFEKLHRVV
ncbi:MAG TPA: DNA primase [Lutibacter sp.]|nr:DNA primase [Lutibacter sp.]